MVGTPCLKVVQLNIFYTSYTEYGSCTGKKYLKNRSGPYSMPRVLRALALRGPKTVCELNVTGALVINPSNHNQMVQIG